MIINEESAQVSTELILLIAGMLVVVILATTTYKNYIIDFNNEINNTEVQNLKNKLDKINNLIKGG